MSPSGFGKREIEQAVNRGFGGGSAPSGSGDLPLEKGSVSTFERRLDAFPGDITIDPPASAAGAKETVLRRGIELPTTCIGFRAVDVAPNDGTVRVSVNGQGFRRLYDGDVIDGATIETLNVLMPAWAETTAPSCVLQVWGMLVR